MKRTSLIIGSLLILANAVHAQVTLEHSYAAESYMIDQWNMDINPRFLYILHLNQGSKYVFSDSSDAFILYNDDHSLFRTLEKPVIGGNEYWINHISDRLVNNDDNLELLISRSTQTPPSTGIIKVVSETGTEYLSIDSAEIQLTFPSYSPIFRVGESYKLIVARQNGAVLASGDLTTYAYEVYGFPGSLPAQIAETPVNDMLGNAYPNPTQSLIRLPYRLPIGVNEAELKIFDINGSLIERKRIGNAFNDLFLNTVSYSSGTYQYVIETPSGQMESKRFVVN